MVGGWAKKAIIWTPCWGGTLEGKGGLDPPMHGLPNNAQFGPKVFEEKVYSVFEITFFSANFGEKNVINFHYPIY